MTAALAFLALLPVPLTERLAARDYRSRAAAHRALERCGGLAVPALERGLTHKDPEVRGRCAVLLRPYALALAERDARAFPCPPFWERFWLWFDSVTLARYWDADYDRCRQTYLWTVSQLLQRRPRAEILAELARMAGAAKGSP